GHRSSLSLPRCIDICQIRTMSKQTGLPVLGQEQRTCCAPLTREPLGADEAARLAHVLKALADPARLRLLSLIGSHDGGEACGCDLTGAVELTAPANSRHPQLPPH